VNTFKRGGILHIPPETNEATAYKHGTRWTDTDEEEELKRRFRLGTPIHDLCVHFGRRTGSIVSRLLQLRLISRDVNGCYRYCIDSVELDESTTPTLQKTKEPAMSTKLIESKSFVLGRDATEMADAEIFKLIAKTEAELASLKGIKTASVKLADHIARVETELTALAAYLDART
jgi:hypothetical protein